ncbi:ABC transporter ATP-binding protein [Amycolatopsis nalaikhensis]|uniref:ABC transporter ATP-binding protein n=1 Tax=Amycolatopsis nalaikhensis TaxID=715472 RepID=A0ABY8XQU1_9PSEU|nr:ABC transporter ATP-binding protein [Amycolatopsis sp. 2-2]WIV57992.1 ABC transporter ATP-binding protein [Amycolatopsis sp. 2-2]
MTIDAVGLTKQYRDILAVDDLTLHTTRGEIYALLGLNGSGKTTTIRMLLGLIRPTRGQVSLFEEPVEKAVSDVIARLGLQPHAHHRAQTLSLGNKQRLALAKALLHQPDLLLLDEPANGLDPAGVAEIRSLLHDLAHHNGVTILLSSHILTEVARLATRFGVLDHGRLVWEDATTELVAQARPRLRVTVHAPGHATAALRAAGHTVSAEDGELTLTEDRAIHHPDEIATQLVTAGCPPTRLAVEQDDLETCFLRLVSHT